jgi:hypothetical protein
VIGEVERLLADEPSSDDALRRVVALLRERLDGCDWAGLAFAEGEDLVPGPAAGRRHPGVAETAVDVVYDGLRVGRLAVSPPADAAVLERVAGLIAPHCLVGWDTGGVEWEAAENWEPPQQPPEVV